MSEYIEVGQPLQFTDPNTPTRVGEIVENVGDIYNIPAPRLGMQVFVKSEKKSFVITSLKSKVIGGVDVPEAAVETFEPVGAKSFTWNNDTDPSNMNDFVTAGVYDIKGERTRDNDNLPILNTGGGHSFNARLTVLDSSISGSGEDDDKCITQVLSFSNRLGQGEVYIRTGKGSSLDNLTWENWSTLQRNVYVGSLDSKVDLRNYIDNGIYSGVFRYGSANNDLRTFVMVVINDYAIGLSPRRVSQFLYSIDKSTGKVSYETQTCEDETWKGWEILNKSELDSMISAEIKKVTDGIDPDKIDSIKDIVTWIDAHGGDVTAIYNAIQQNTNNIGDEVNRATEAEENIKKNSIKIEESGLQIVDNELQFVKRNLDNSLTLIDHIPAATTEKAGIMSAEDKKALDTATSRALRTLFIAAGAEYNNTDSVVTKTAPWGDSVEHLPKHYYLNGLGDITEEQMMAIYNAGKMTSTTPIALYKQTAIRTTIPVILSGGEGEKVNLYYICSYAQSMEVFRATKSSTLTTSRIANAFDNCTKLKYIVPILKIDSITVSYNIANAFKACRELVLCKLYNLKISTSFSDSPLLSKESILYTIQNAAPTSAITITLHADAYARLEKDADIVAALAAQPLVTLVSA